jgi:hypothetical protein
MPAPHTEATTDYWQTLIGADEAAGLQGPPWRLGVPVPLPDGRFLVLPIRALAAEPRHGVASLICNHAALDVVDALSAMLAQTLRPLQAELVVGLPTRRWAIRASTGTTKPGRRRCSRSPRRSRASACTWTRTCCRCCAAAAS